MAIQAESGVRSVARSIGLLVISLLVLINGDAVLVPVQSSLVSALGTCQVSSLNPHSAPDGSVTGFDFTVTGSSDSLAWVKITSPSGNLTIVGAASDWLPTVTYDSSTATYSGSPINPGNPIALHVDGDISFFSPSNWTVAASTSSSGASSFACSGDTSISVIDTTPPNITSISANASTTTATVTWQTDKLTNSEVDYGTSTSYGTTLTDGSYVTGHSFNLTNLLPNTTYHYQVMSVDQSGNSVNSVDGTFRTAAVPTSTTTPGQTSNSSTTPVNVQVTDPNDKVPPTITLTSKLPAVVRSMPTISGAAQDDKAVARVEYSSDGGKNWLVADSVTGLGSKKVTFNFTPINLNDGTYNIVARAVDRGGNTAQTTPLEVVVDTQPPIMGGMVLAFGPQVLLPDTQGIITTLPGVDLNVTFSSSGGVTNAKLQATNSNNSGTIAASYALRYADDSGLWSGVISFTQAGLYKLDIHAADGANNTSTRTVAMVRVIDTGNVISANGPVRGAQLTVNYLDPDTNNWAVWDGQPYGQANPQRTDTRGSYRFLLPAGTYYVHIEANGFQSSNTERFTLTDPSPFTSALHLQQNIGIGSIRLPWINLAAASVAGGQSNGSTRSTSQTALLIGHSLPTFTLDTTAGTSENTITWLGKPTIVSLLSSWDPATSEELPELERLATNTDLNVKVVGLQENAPRLRALSSIAGSKVVWLADPTGQIGVTLKAGSIPTHYFVDRKGVIRAIKYGTLSYDDMLTTLTDMQ